MKKIFFQFVCVSIFISGCQSDEGQDNAGIKNGLLLFSIVCLVALIVGVKNSMKKQQKLLKEYEAAIKSGDKKLALQIGRMYYLSKSGKSKLTILDEQSIANDLSIIK